jgi:hypothetical protein
MAFGPNPSISAEAARKALGATEVAAANQHDVTDERAALDEAELHDLERADYYPDTPPAAELGPTPAAPGRSILDRLLHRRPR